ncbi:TetR/AcrR family transcriptional regulator [Gordonia hydrophobica]|uniref:Helix-turn-helix domain-containing protein n=1 Tax=Gordonia hydrophobica TaxID=40516 RepID=A0ABZ2TYH0_9ACTN|nr:helix-turn-helix domain-containing protein [Gordonia hydrophobica]MBM7367001.1 AcrR family transcriptional regulator [Gordonia hydrophobica]
MGLRERQRLQTLRTLRAAAVDLVREQGLTETTIAEIADRAGVSRRTFFNYYACKEDAVLGAGAPTVPAGPLDEFLQTPTGPERLDRAIALLLAVAASIRQAGARHVDHARLVEEYPQLTDRMRQHGLAAQESLDHALTEQLADAPPDDLDTARAQIQMAGAVLHFAYKSDPDVFDNPASPALAKALEVFRRTIKELA